MRYSFGLFFGLAVLVSGAGAATVVFRDSAPQPPTSRELWTPSAPRSG